MLSSPNRFVSATLAGVASAVLVAIAVPVSANEPGRAETASAAADAAPPAPEAKPVKYCMLMELTGSRITRKICKTRQEWLDEGVDVLAK